MKTKYPSVIYALIFLLAVTAMTACQGPFDLKTVLGLDLETLKITPNGIIVDKDIGPITFSASPAGSFVWSVVSGTGSIDPATGVYTPTGAVEYVTVQAEDPSTGQYGRARIRFEDGVDLRILAQVQTLYPGDMTPLYAYGGNGGGYSYSISVNNTGAAALSGPSYTAGPIPGTDTLMVQDAGAEHSATVTITVLDPAASVPDIDYTVDSVVINTSPTQLGGAVDAEFSYSNAGAAGGGANVAWTAYASTNTNLSGIVKQLDSGTVGSLGGGSASASPQSIGGTWPNEPGSYYIVLHLTPTSDVNSGNNTGASGITSMSVSYNATALPAAGSVAAGAAIGPPGLDFTITNGGSVGGLANWTWTAYLSTDATLGFGDQQIDSGSPGAITSAGGTATITVDGGNWPTSGGPYYILVEWTSPDDVGTPKTAASGAQNITIDDVDYSPVSGPAGGVVTVGSALSGVTFTIENIGADPGSFPVDWTAWLSSDTTPGTAGDVQLAMGSTGQLGPNPPGPDSGAITVTGNWTVPEGDYWLIVTWSAPDDINIGNDLVISSAQYQVQSSDVDYVTDIVPVGGASVLAGASAPITDSFNIKNSGIADGTQPIDWTAWMSLGNSVLDAGDYQISSGTIATPLNAGQSSAAIPIGGSWPDIPGSYSLIITWNAVDDNDNSNDSMASAAPTTVSDPVTDYGIVNVPLPGGTNQASGPVSGSFTVQNFGPDDDPGAGFSWHVYASSDPIYNSGDALIDSGSEAAQALSDGAVAINYSGMWPSIGGEYHIVVVIEATHDTTPGNDQSYDTAGPTSVVNLTDYQITSATYHPLGVAGDPINTRPLPPTVPGLVDYTFRIDEIGGVAGVKKVDYNIYASTDTILDAGDNNLKTGFIKAGDVGAGGNYTVNFNDGLAWPNFQSYYYLIISINAGDDANAANDLLVAGPIQVPAYTPDGDNDDSGPAPPPITAYTDLNAVVSGALNAGELVRSDAIMGAFNSFDTFGFTCGADMTSVTARATWPNSADDIDLYFWNTSGNEITSLDTTDNVEGPLTIVGLTPGATYYIGVYFYLDANSSGNAGGDYVLTIQGLP